MKIMFIWLNISKVNSSTKLGRVKNLPNKRSNIKTIMHMVGNSFVITVKIKESKNIKNQLSQ